MKQRLQERMFDLIAMRAQTADSNKRAQLTAEIQKIQRMLEGM
jgi:predicted Mrr-cat superfamily restriction endonuclease